MNTGLAKAFVLFQYYFVREFILTILKRKKNVIATLRPEN